MRRVAGGEGGMVREQEGVKAHLLVCGDGCGVAVKGVVDGGVDRGGGGACRRQGSRRGTSMRGGGLASLELGEALRGVVVVGLGLEWLVHGGQQPAVSCARRGWGSGGEKMQLKGQ